MIRKVKYHAIKFWNWSKGVIPEPEVTEESEEGIIPESDYEVIPGIKIEVVPDNDLEDMIMTDDDMQHVQR